MPAAERTCLDLEEFAKDIAPVEIDMSSHSPTFSGRILKFQRGSRSGDISQPANHDTVLIEAYGPDGSPVSATPVLLSAYHLYQTRHDIDTPEDFSVLFSNRHELAGVAVGSTTHRSLIYQLVDPDGTLGLYQGGSVPDDKVEEGVLTRYIRFGLTAPPMHWGSWNSSGTDARRNHGNAPPDIEQLLWGIATARIRPGFEEGFAEDGLRLAGLWCSLIDVDPILARPDLIQEAKRAYLLGQDCYYSINNLLHPTTFRRRMGRSGELQWNAPPTPTMVVKWAALYIAIIDIILAEESFKFYPGADPLDDRSTYVSPSWGWPRQIFGTTRARAPIRSLQRLAAGQSPFATPEVRAKAEQAAIMLAFGEPGESEEDRLTYELDRRYYKALVIPRIGMGRHHHTPVGENWDSPLIRLQVKWLCRYGWGDIEDMEPRLQNWISEGALYAYGSDSPTMMETYAAVAANMGRLVGAVAVSAGAERIHGPAILEMLNDSMESVEEIIEDILKVEEPTLKMQRKIRSYGVFKAAYDAETADPKACNPGSGQFNSATTGANVEAAVRHVMDLEQVPEESEEPADRGEPADREETADRGEPADPASEADPGLEGKHPLLIEALRRKEEAAQEREARASVGTAPEPTEPATKSAQLPGLSPEEKELERLRLLEKRLKTSPDETLWRHYYEDQNGAVVKRLEVAERAELADQWKVLESKSLTPRISRRLLSRAIQGLE